MKKTKILAAIMALCLAIGAAGCGQVSQSTASASTASQQQTDTVVVAMNVESEPASGFDPAYGWGAGEHVHEPLIQSTLGGYQCGYEHRL